LDKYRTAGGCACAPAWLATTVAFASLLWSK
jgi:hypothetical protein